MLLELSITAFLEAKKRSKKFRDFLDKAALKAPIFGDLVYKAIIARYSRTLATTFAAGVPLIDALESTAGATNNVVYEDAVMKIREDVATGQQLQFAMRVTNKFPSMAIQMVAIGEESGALDAMLDKVATHYENEVDNAVDGLTSMMEPLIMAVLGVLVGGLVIAMYLPIFQMGSGGLMQENLIQNIISYFIQNPTALYIAVGLFSLCIGSFLNVVIYRTPKMIGTGMAYRLPDVFASGTAGD